MLLRSFRQLSPGAKRLVCATATVPISIVGAGLVQGISVLIEYRLHHRDAPQPISPASGTVVVSSQDAGPKIEEKKSAGAKVVELFQRKAKSLVSNTTTDHNANKIPSQLQLQSISGSTMQPLRLLVVGDSLAVGVGISESASPILPESISRTLSKALGGRAVHWTCIGTSGASAGRIVRDIESYHERGDDKKEDETGVTERRILPLTRKRIRAWLDSESENKEQQDGPNQRVKRWLRRRANGIEWLQEKERDLWRHWRARRSMDTSEEESNTKEYDVAVVLTGLNDVKDSTLPFLASDSKEEKEKRMNERQSSGGYEAQLKKILQVLKEKMNSTGGNKSSQDIDVLKTSERISRRSSGRSEPYPLIVLPGLPVSIVPVFQWFPLKWFLVPLINGVDNQKRSTSEKYSSVLFVNSPDIESVRQYEAGLGRIQSKRRAEDVLLLIQDIGNKAKHQVENAMQKYYEIKEKIVAREKRESETERQYEQSYHQHSSSSRPIALSPPVGSKLFSRDGIHPNDEGYDYYGRYIANAIVAEWEK